MHKKQNNIICQDNFITKFLIKTRNKNNYEIIIDTEDCFYLKNCLLSISKEKNYIYPVFYFNKTRKRLHRIIMNCPKEMVVDHINGDTLDNRKCNLRVCTNAQNIMNSFPHKNKSCEFKGVCFSKKYKKWQSQITFEKKNYFLGYFENKVDAAIVYNNAAIKYFGEFARLNEVN